PIIDTRAVTGSDPIPRSGSTDFAVGALSFVVKLVSQRRWTFSLPVAYPSPRTYPKKTHRTQRQQAEFVLELKYYPDNLYAFGSLVYTFVPSYNCLCLRFTILISNIASFLLHQIGRA
ncbi:hypothetical protein WG66_013010, partial [Moniliophthora roreri]